MAILKDGKRSLDDGDDQDVDPGYTVDDRGIAIIPVAGVLMRNLPWYYSYFGIQGCSYTGIASALKQAMADPRVSRVLLSVDSPGGEVGGVHAAADAISSAAQEIPLAAHVETQMCSAALWLGSQASRVTANRGAEVGSIGVYGVVVDYTRAMENEGVKVTVVSSGKFKGAGAYGTAMTDDQLAEEQRSVDELCAAFVADVARGRSVSAPDIQPLADGRVWSAADAQRLGLIDAIAADPLEDMMTTTKRTSADQILDLVEQFPSQAKLIKSMVAADQDEEAIKKACERAEDELKVQAKVASLERSVADLTAKFDAKTKEAADLSLKLADLQHRHDRLSALKGGTEEASKVKPDTQPDAVKKITSAASQTMGGRALAAFIKAGGIVEG